jgi:predicted dehydrogenase
MRDTVGVGIIGTGFAQYAQMPGFLHTDGARLVAVASGHVENARSAAARFRIPHVCRDFHDLVAHPEVDLVVVSSPPHTHREAALAAVRAGKHVLCEKPMALDVGEAREMTLAAESAGLLNLIDHELRFTPARREARRLIDSGYVGRPRHVLAVYRGNLEARFKKGFNWWHRSAAGGGILGAVGSHVVDALRWWFGEVGDVDCRLRTFVTERPDAETGEMRRVETDDFASLRLGMAGGVTVEASLSSVATGAPEHRFEIVGDEGALVIDDELRTLTGWRGAGPAPHAVEDPARGLEGMRDNVWASGFVHFAREIVGALREGQTAVEGAATFRDGAHVQAVLDAARRSHDRGRREAVEEPFA